MEQMTGLRVEQRLQSEGSVLHNAENTHHQRLPALPHEVFTVTAASEGNGDVTVGRFDKRNHV